MTAATAPKKPCGSCPYVKTTPAGLWAREEYEKLPAYDGYTALQSPHVFMCHQRDGCVCGGWLLTHGADELLAVRLGLAFGTVSASVLDYDPPGVEVFASGAEACAHGLSGISNPSPEARRKMEGLRKLPGIKTLDDE